MVKYSVIVPVYNVETVLPRCIESILNQSVSDFELILIDDGSPDQSGAICDEYAAKDARVRVIHQKNAGVSAARNAGMRAAKGEFIVFADSDDFVDRDLLMHLSESDADLVMVGFSDYSDHQITKVLLDDYDKWELQSEEGIQKYLNTCGSVFVWAKRYRKSIIDCNGLCFREDMRFHEDNIFNHAYLLCAHTAESIRWSGYYHCQYESPTLSSSFQNVSFTERNWWRQLSCEQFRKYPSIQRIYISQTLYFSECEFVQIAKGKGSFWQKCKSIGKIISDSFFRKCLKEMPDTFPRDVRAFCNLRQSAFIVMKYGR